MRAEMKLATGLVPVTMGLAMALLSGMAKAEDKAAKPQPLADAVSAQTTLPSVGHRPVTPFINDGKGTWELSAFSRYNIFFTHSTLYARPGFALSLFIDGDEEDKLADADNDIFGEDETLPLNTAFNYSVNGFSCNIYRGDELIAQKKHCMSPGVANDQIASLQPYIFQPEDVGHVIRIDYWLYTENKKTSGYKPNPDRSIIKTFSVSVGSDIDAGKSELTMPETIRINRKSFEVVVKPIDDKGEIIEGAALSFEFSAVGSNKVIASDTKFRYPYEGSIKFSDYPEVVPGEYTVKVFYFLRDEPLFTKNITITER